MFTYMFQKWITADKLQKELVDAGLTSVLYIDTLEDQIQIHFEEELSPSDVSILNTKVDEHTLEIPSIPDVTPRQIRQALILSGVTLQQIDDAINSLSEPTKSLARVEWEYSNMFQRHRPLVGQVAAMLGWTDQQVDDLWHLAGTL